MSWSAGDEYWQSSFWNTVTAKPYSYLVRKEGLYDEAIDAYGKLQYGGSGDAGGADGTKADEVIQAAIDGIPAGTAGGIYFKRGAYPLESTVTVTTLRALIMIGEGANMEYGTYFSPPTGLPAFDFSGAAYGQALHLTLRDFAVHGATGTPTAGETGLKLTSVQSSDIRRIEFDSLDKGIDLAGGSSYNVFEAVKGYDVNYGVHASAGDNFANRFSWMSFANVHNYGFKDGTGDVTHAVFHRFGVESSADAYGIYLGQASRNICIQYGYFVDVGDTANVPTIYLKGYSAPYPLLDATIKKTYFNRCYQPILTDRVNDITIEQCESLSSDVTGLTLGANTVNATLIHNKFDSYSLANTGLTRCINDDYGDVHHIEAHTADDTLTIAESNTIHTNLGAGATITLTLPQDAVAGHTFEFAVMTAQALRVDPGAAGAIYINGAKQLDDRYVWADDEGESVKLVADGNGDWVALYTQGTWTVE